MTGKTIHERLAYALASSSVIGDRMSYNEILDHIKRHTPNERECMKKAVAAFEHLQTVSRKIGMPCPNDFDEWLDDQEKFYKAKRMQH